MLTIQATTVASESEPAVVITDDAKALVESEAPTATGEFSSFLFTEIFL